MIRFICTDNDYACQVLDEHDIPFDLDGGNRIMVDENYADEARLIMEENGVEFDEV